VRGGDRSHAAKTAAARRREERERRLRSRRLRIRLQVVATALVVVGVIAGAVALYRSSAFTVTEVEVTGNDRVPTSRVLDIAAVPADATLLRFPADEVRERLLADPWIAEATVNRGFPDAMRIHVTERVPVLQVDTGAESFWLVDAEAMVVATQTPDATSTLVVVRDIEDLVLQVGRRAASNALANALEVWNGLSQELAGEVRAISAASVDKTTLITTNDVEILVGSAEDIGKKDLIAREILREQAGAVVYVNVRTVDRPTWRRLDE